MLLIWGRQATIRIGMILVAVIAGALSLARPIVWAVLDARRIGPFSAGLRYLWLWVGFVLAASLIRSPSGRLVAYGWVLVGSLALMLPFPRLDLGIEPDLAAYFNLATLLAAISLWLVGWIMAHVSMSRREQGPSKSA